jgi:hypothetical protein
VTQGTNAQGGFGRTPREPIRAALPDCHLCSWVARPKQGDFELKMLNRSCDSHGRVDALEDRQVAVL